MAETVIRAADDPRVVATDLIDEHHEHLQTAKILWLFTTSKRTRGNRVVLGTSARTTALTRYLSARADKQAADFIVLIEEKRWQIMLATQRQAFVDSLLCRMEQRETINKRSGKITHTWVTVAPDVEEFSDVILRHGLWLPEHQAFARAVAKHGGRQLEMTIVDPREDPEEAEAEADNGKPPDRETTVDGQGVVQTTRRLDPDPDPNPEPDGDDADDGDKDEPEPALAGTESAASQPVVNGTAKPADWRERTGVDRGRRRRGTRSSEQQEPIPLRGATA
jgi:hypothetical protein